MLAIDSLSASRIVLSPGSNETIIDQTPTPSVQAHRGVGVICAKDDRSPTAGAAAVECAKKKKKQKSRIASCDDRDDPNCQNKVLA